MSKSSPPPTTEPVIDQSGVATIAWILFFNQVYQGDQGTDWIPEFNGLTTVGTPKITGRWYKLSNSLAYFSIHVEPATNTTATAGTTYVGNFPAKFRQDGACHAVSGLLGSNSGMVEAQSQRIYVPGWNGVTVPLVIVGTVEIM